MDEGGEYRVVVPEVAIFAFDTTSPDWPEGHTAQQSYEEILTKWPEAILEKRINDQWLPVQPEGTT